MHAATKSRYIALVDCIRNAVNNNCILKENIINEIINGNTYCMFNFYIQQNITLLQRRGDGGPGRRDRLQLLSGAWHIRWGHGDLGRREPRTAVAGMSANYTRLWLYTFYDTQKRIEFKCNILFCLFTSLVVFCINAVFTRVNRVVLNTVTRTVCSAKMTGLLCFWTS